MSAPSVSDVITASWAQSGGTDLAVSVPTHQPGDLILAIGLCGQLFARDLLPPSGWSTIIQDEEHTLDSQQLSFGVWYRVAGESEGATYTFTRTSQSTNVRVIVLAISGAADPIATPIVFASDTTTPDPALQPNAPSVDATHADSLILRFATQRTAPWQANAWAMPIGHVEVLQETSTWGFALARATAGVGPTGAATFVHTDYGQANAYWRCTLAIAPGPSALPIWQSQPIIVQ